MDLEYILEELKPKDYHKESKCLTLSFENNIIIFLRDCDESEIRLRDVIKITDEDILNSMAYTLWNKSYKEVINYRSKEYSDFLKGFVDFLTSPVKTYNLNIGFDDQQSASNYHLRLYCEMFNNFKYSMYITDTFIVSETSNTYFKLKLLNLCYEKFERLGKLSEILNFLDNLLLPYDLEYKSFFRMGTS